MQVERKHHFIQHASNSSVLPKASVASKSKQPVKPCKEIETSSLLKDIALTTLIGMAFFGSGLMALTLCERVYHNYHCKANMQTWLKKHVEVIKTLDCKRPVSFVENDFAHNYTLICPKSFESYDLTIDKANMVDNKELLKQIGMLYNNATSNAGDILSRYKGQSAWECNENDELSVSFKICHYSLSAQLKDGAIDSFNKVTNWTYHLPTQLKDGFDSAVQRVKSIPDVKMPNFNPLVRWEA